MPRLQVMNEGDKCTECNGRMTFPVVENCSCHINAPCSACVENPLTCNTCGWVYEAPSVSYRHLGGGISERLTPNKRKVHVFANGRIMDWDYDSRSGSTMVYTGKYEGKVSSDDIINYFGDGTFGHRGPSFTAGRFEYTLITD